MTCSGCQNKWFHGESNAIWISLPKYILPPLSWVMLWGATSLEIRLLLSRRLLSLLLLLPLSAGPSLEHYRTEFSGLLYSPVFPIMQSCKQQRSWSDCASAQPGQHHFCSQLFAVLSKLFKSLASVLLCLDVSVVLHLENSFFSWKGLYSAAQAPLEQLELISSSFYHWLHFLPMRSEADFHLKKRSCWHALHREKQLILGYPYYIGIIALNLAFLKSEYKSRCERGR